MRSLRSRPALADGEVTADDSLNVVFTSNFFEHLHTKRELRETLMQARRCLRPGGGIIALGPNIRYLPGKYWDFYDCANNTALARRDNHAHLQIHRLDACSSSCV